MSRELAGCDALRPFIGRELMPTGPDDDALRDFVRNGAVTYWHQSCMAKMGRDPMSVVDAQVYGVGRLRVADGSIMPRVTASNTMGPCVVIGERAGKCRKPSTDCRTLRTNLPHKGCTCRAAWTVSAPTCLGCD